MTVPFFVSCSTLLAVKLIGSLFSLRAFRSNLPALWSSRLQPARGVHGTPDASMAIVRPSSPEVQGRASVLASAPEDDREERASGPGHEPNNTAAPSTLASRIAVARSGGVMNRWVGNADLHQLASLPALSAVRPRAVDTLQHRDKSNRATPEGRGDE